MPLVKYFAVFQSLLYVMILPTFIYNGGRTSDWDIYDGAVGHTALLAAVIIGCVQFLPAIGLRFIFKDNKALRIYMRIAAFILTLECINFLLIQSDLLFVVSFVLEIAGLLTGLYFMQICYSIGRKGHEAGNPFENTFL